MDHMRQFCVLNVFMFQLALEFLPKKQKLNREFIYRSLINRQSFRIEMQLILSIDSQFFSEIVKLSNYEQFIRF